LAADWEIRGGVVADVFTLTAYPASIWLKDGFIVHVQPTDSPTGEGFFDSPLLPASNVYDATGQVIVPGFVDTHMHVESIEVKPSIFGQAAVMWGTTTVFTDCHEVANVGGGRAFRYMHEDSKLSPTRQFMLIPSCVPAAEGLEQAGAEWYADDIRQLYQEVGSRVVGTAEVMDYIGVLAGDRRMRDILQATRECGGYAQGHAHGVFGRALSSLRLQGIQGNHEVYDPATFLAAMRAGMYVDLSIVSSLASSDSFLREIMEQVVVELGSLDKLTFCTDDRNIAALLKDGHINLAVARFLSAAGSRGREERFVLETLRAATLNAWREYGIGDHAGAIAAGYLADLSIFEGGSVDGVDWTKPPRAVFVDGQKVVDDGKLTPNQVSEAVDRGFLRTVESENTVRLNPITADQLIIRVPKGFSSSEAIIRVLDHSGDPITNSQCLETLPVVDGCISLNGRDDLTAIAVFHRHGRHNNIGYGVAKGLCLQGGGLATTVAHDGHNLVVIYKPDAIDLAVDAVNELIEIGGGVTYHAPGGGVFTKHLPLFGLMSLEDAEPTAASIEALAAGFRKYNGDQANPMVAALLSLTVIPSIRVTDLGIVDTMSKSLVPLIVD
jgi:adenine deaminase